MRNFISFAVWLLKKWFVSEDGWIRTYERAVLRDPGPMFMLTIFIYGAVWVLSLVPLAVLDLAVPAALAAWTILAVAVFGNYFRILLVEQYRLFQQERQRLFKTIKGSHNG